MRKWLKYSNICAIISGKMGKGVRMVRMEQKYSLLKECFGYSGFRNGQEELIDAQLAGRDAFGVMPTGGGKSLCYQIPAMMMSGITLVVSPLISLMKDQVMALKNIGVAAAYINSSLKPEQIPLVYRNMELGKYKIIYIAPERLLTDGFLQAVSKVRISMLAVDEAHCISQWGQDFRPSYLRIAEFLNLLPCRPVVSAFTATATAGVREDVVRLLGLRDPEVVITGFDRPNLRFEVLRPEKKPAALQSLIAQRKGKCGIVYCSTRKDVEKVCSQLQEQGFSATRYHAGLEDDERRGNQDDFIYDRCHIMVATNAFGMGINKSNVSFVIHYNMPQSVESYYQEAGRAGRDGSAADCILLYSEADVRTAKYLILNCADNELLSAAQQRYVTELDLIRLEQMIAYCKTEQCLRGYILDYFGQKHEESCCNCGNCSTDLVSEDITEQAKTVIFAIMQVRQKIGYDLGPTTIVRLLHGSKEKRIMELRLDEVPAYGQMSKNSRAEIKAVMDALESQGYLQVHPVYGSIYPTEKVREILHEQKCVEMKVQKTAEPIAKPQQNRQAEEGMINALKDLRMQLAREAGVPAYIIFSNATLQDMAAKEPCTMEQFLGVNGVGQFKAEQYGEAFLAQIRKYRENRE